MNMTDEEYWGCVLDKSNPEIKWEISDDDAIESKLCLSQATLGVGTKTNERNIVEIACIDDDGEEISSHAILSMSIGLCECLPLEIGVSNNVKLKLVSGSGPIHLVGSILMRIFDDQSDDASDASDDEECEANHPHHIVDKENLLKPKMKAIEAKEESDDEESDEEAGSNAQSSDDSDDEKQEEESDEDAKDSDESASSDDEKIKEIPINKMKKGVMKAKMMNKGSAKEGKPNKKVTFSAESKISQKPNDLPAIKIALSKIQSLPKSQEKFKNFMAANLKVTDNKLINDAWMWVSKNRIK